MVTIITVNKNHVPLTLICFIQSNKVKQLEYSSFFCIVSYRLKGRRLIMHLLSLPSVDEQFKTKSGECFIVIGRGTQGIIIEYLDGRVELVPIKKWGTMNPDAAIVNKTH